MDRTTTRRSPEGNGVRSRAARTIRKTAKVRFNVKRLVLSVLALGFAVYFLCTVVTQQSTLSRKNDEITALNDQIEEASRETDRLQEEYDSVSDPEYLERMAHEKLGLVLPNERVYIDLSSGN